MPFQKIPYFETEGKERVFRSRKEPGKAKNKALCNLLIHNILQER